MKQIVLVAKQIILVSKQIAFVLALAYLFFSCKKASFLDNNTSSNLNESTIFADSALTTGFLINIYQNTPFSFNKQRWEIGSTEQATDDAEYTLSSPARRTVILYSSSYTPQNFPFFDFWGTPYTNIRSTNLLLSKLPVTPLSPATRKKVAAEARFLRAWFYENLVINFGGVPLIGDKVFGITDVVNFPRNSFAETIDYISKQLDTAALDLPAPSDQPEAEYGRVTKGACLALKSRLLLYAASPLFNGGAFTPATADQVKLVSYPVYDVNYWQKAADAANAVIQSGYYSLYKDNTTAPGYGFYQVFLKRVNPEYIFFYNRAPNRDMETIYNPGSRGGGRYSQPSQNLTECFPMKNGKPITDPASGYDPVNPYTNRDPRFGYSIIYNGSLYYSTNGNAKTAVLTYVGSPNGDGFGSTLTGYYGRKMCDENISANSGFTTDRGWPLIRYAEILLNYAEAINETGQTALAYPTLIQLRDRAGIDPGTDGLYGIAAGMGVSEMRTFIQNERRIELAFEDHRWDDVRRWKIAMVTQNGYNKCMKITKTGSVYTYQVLNATDLHRFNPNNYILPIPNSEILKAPAMLQNPGW